MKRYLLPIALFSAGCFLLSGAEKEAGLPPSKAPIVHFTFDEESGADCADHAGKAKGVILHNMRGVRHVPGKIGNALEFSAGDKKQRNQAGAVRLTGCWDPSLEKAMTIEMWLRMGEKADWQKGHMYILTSPCGHYGPGLMVKNLWARFMLNSGPGEEAYKKDKKTLCSVNMSCGDIRGQWVHLAIVYDGVKKQGTVYLNGQAGKTENMVIHPISDKKLGLGSQYEGLCCGFDGAIDDLRIYNRVLSPMEICGHARLEL